MSLSFVLVGSTIKRFRTAVKALAAIGSELLVEALPEKLILRAINSAHSAFLAISLSSHFFESYNVFSQRAVVQAGVLIKHLLATFRSARVSSMSCELNEQQGSLKVTLRCDNGLLKRYSLDINTTDILQANLDASVLPVSVVAEAAELNKLLNTFQSTLDEVSIIALPMQLSSAAATAAGQAAAQRCVRLQSFYDPAKAAGSKALHTSMSLDTSHVFKTYSNRSGAPSDVTVNLKDLKALVGLCVELGCDVGLRFDEAGVPLLAMPHATGVTAMDITAELILSTLQESVNRADDEGDAAWQQQQQQQQNQAAGAANGVPQQQQQQGAAETMIAPATTMAGAAAGAGGGAAGDTPQGGRGQQAPGSVLRFRQQAPGAAAGGGGGSGGASGGAAGRGGSGGRARSGGGISRFDNLLVGLEHQEELQQQERQQQQQHFQQQQQQQQPLYQQHHAAAASAGAGAPAAAAGPALHPHQQQQSHWANGGSHGNPSWQQQPPPEPQPSWQQQQQSMEVGQASVAYSLDDVEALPGHRRLSRSPAPTGAAAAGGVGYDAPQQPQQQWDSNMQQQPYQPQQFDAAAGAAAGNGDSGGAAGDQQQQQQDDAFVMDEDEELPATPEQSDDEMAGGTGAAGGGGWGEL